MQHSKLPPNNGGWLIDVLGPPYHMFGTLPVPGRPGEVLSVAIRGSLQIAANEIVDTGWCHDKYTMLMHFPMRN